MSSSWGNLIKISIFGESHGTAIGVVLDGLPSGMPIDMEALLLFMDRRRPGKDRFSTSRKPIIRILFPAIIVDKPPVPLWLL